jgi:hypothetical protein
VNVRDAGPRYGIGEGGGGSGFRGSIIAAQRLDKLAQSTRGAEQVDEWASTVLWLGDDLKQVALDLPKLGEDAKTTFVIAKNFAGQLRSHASLELKSSKAIAQECVDASKSIARNPEPYNSAVAKVPEANLNLVRRVVTSFSYPELKGVAVGLRSLSSAYFGKDVSRPTGLDDACAALATLASWVNRNSSDDLAQVDT